VPTTSPTDGSQSQAGTPARILDAAERAVQSRGFNAFSYGDIANELRITTAALHYHFPRKAELGKALINRYTARFGERLRVLDAEGGSARFKLDQYVEIYADVLRQGRMCLCGVLAAEFSTLSAGMQTAVRDFFDQNEAWIGQVLEKARREGTARFPGAVPDTARMIISGLEGAMLVAVAYGDAERFLQAAACLLAGLDLAP
jgi:TetR/AcrR family transcriptional regulator, transcriptional repressor for nem operon